MQGIGGVNLGESLLRLNVYCINTKAILLMGEMVTRSYVESNALNLHLASVHNLSVLSTIVGLRLY